MTGEATYGNLGLRSLTGVGKIGSRGLLILAFLVAGGAFSLQLSGLDPRAPVGADSASSNSQIASSLAFLTVSAFGAAGWRRIAPLLKVNAVVLLLPALAIASTAWAPEPAVALRRALAFTATVLSGVAVAAYLPGARALRFLVQAAAAAMAVSLFYVVLEPAYALHQVTDGAQSVHAGQWRGVFIHRTTLGRLAALSLAMAVFGGGEALGPMAVRVGVILASCLCLVMARSGGGFASAAILMATPGVVWAFRRAAERNLVLALGLAVGAAATALLITPTLAPFVLQLLGKDLTLTGRTDFWRLMLRAAAERPWLGYGYSTGFREVVAKVVAAHSAYGFVPNAQNGYLDVVLNLGLVGLAAALAVMVLTAWRAAKIAFRPGGAILPLLVVIFIIETNAVEATLISANDIFMLISVTALIASGDILRTPPK